jgi:hypothetical protein
MLRAEAYERSDVSFSLDGLKLLVWFCAAVLPWAVIYAFVHRLLGI